MGFAQSAWKEPPWPSKIQGFSFSPLRINQSPQLNKFPTEQQIHDDLQLLSATAHAVRTYSVDGVLGKIPEIARQHGLNVALGAWIDNEEASNRQEIQRLKQRYLENISSIVRVIVGNEAILRKDQTPQQMIKYLDGLRSEIQAPISTAEPWHVWLDNPELAKHVDYLAVHFLPYWEAQPIDNAIGFIKEKYGLLQKTFPGKPIVITEVGWPSRGRTIGAAKASVVQPGQVSQAFPRLG